MNKKGFAGTLVLVIALVAISAGGLYYGITKQQPQEIIQEQESPNVGAFTLVVSQGGSGAQGFDNYPIVGDGINPLSASSSITVASIHATSTSIDSEIEGTLLVNNITVTGTCSGCGGTDDLQDVYNNSAADAQITSADAKDIIFFLQDTATDPNFIVSIDINGGGQFQITSADGSASTTVLTIDENGVLAIGTGTPGAELSVAGGGLFSGHLSAGPIQASSTLDVAATSTFDSHVAIGTSTPQFDAALFIETDDVDEVGLLLREGSGEVADIFQIQNAEAVNIFRVESSGQTDIIHTAVGTDETALELIVNAAGFGDVKALEIIYTTGTLSDGNDEAVIVIDIDEFAATGGTVVGVEVLATEGDANIHGFEVGAQVSPILQHSGDFGNQATSSSSSGGCAGGDDCNTEFTSSVSNVAIFTADNSEITIGDTEKFSEIEVILATVSSQDINAIFSFSTGGTGYTTFVPTDTTDGFRNTGIIAFDPDIDIPTWATDAGGNFTIRIQRTRNNLNTDPIEQLIKIAITDDFAWDLYGGVRIKSLGISTSTPGVGLAVVSTTTILGGDLYVWGQVNIPFVIATSTTASFFGGNLGVGTTTPGAELSVVGAGLFEGELHAAYFTSTSTHENLLGGTLNVTEAATNTFTGGLSVGTGGFLTTTGLTVTGGHILSSGRLEVTSTATSTFAGVISVDDANSTSTFAGTISVESTTGTSTFDNSVDIIGFTDTTRAVRQAACQDTTQAATTTIDWALGNCFDIGPLTQDVTLRQTNFEDAKYQTIVVIGSTKNSDFNINFDDPTEVPTTTPVWYLANSNATDTPRQLLEGDFMIFYNIASSTERGYIQISSGGQPL